ncbi:uncharacterized protein HKW66_Vig0116710 [Vigna angularis]|uniref:Uncharacterized protein n=1 Tax=Phaseolus angularis TaxID=3914 RepID=A0A8T0JY86_PHAAN|nr:uncharacterized protein HKW66_Vig0116710 [Vigna angularis]
MAKVFDIHMTRGGAQIFFPVCLISHFGRALRALLGLGVIEKQRSGRACCGRVRLIEKARTPWVREAQLAHYKYMLVVGEEEANTGQVVRPSEVVVVFASDIGCRSDDLVRLSISIVTKSLQHVLLMTSLAN